jgi:hypothetical protein
LSVRLDNDELCIIEIKSWHRWRGYFRVKRALTQVHRQRRAVGAAYGVIWMPHAQTVVAEFRGGIFVVGGNTKYLIEQIPGIVRYKATIEFPRQPPDYLLAFIKSRRFRWNKTAKRWEGKSSERDAQELRREITHAGGVMVLERPMGESLLEYDYEDVLNVA